MDRIRGHASRGLAQEEEQRRKARLPIAMAGLFMGWWRSLAGGVKFCFDLTFFAVIPWSLEVQGEMPRRREGRHLANKWQASKDQNLKKGEVMGNIDSYTGRFVELVISYAPKLILAIITLVVGLWLIGIVTSGARKAMEKTRTDKTLIPFLTHLLSWGLKLLLFISVASMLGIATTSFIAVLGAAGLAVGLALQGSLANFAGGVLILIFKPYNVGDLVEAQGHLGVVKEVQIFNTILLSPDNKRIIIPNGAVSNGSIVNYSVEGLLRVDMVFGIAYDSDIAKAKEVLHKCLTDHALVLAEPPATVAVSALADSSVNLVVRPWVKASDYWRVYFDISEAAKMNLEAGGISIPFPQRDVHLYQHKPAA